MAYNKGATFVTSRYQVDGETLDIQEALNETIEDVGGIKLDSSSLPVTASGGSSKRTLSDLFSDKVNVEDYGAVGDGVTDDTEAFRAAYQETVNRKISSQSTVFDYSSPALYAPGGKRYRITGSITNASEVNDSASGFTFVSDMAILDGGQGTFNFFELRTNCSFFGVNFQGGGRVGYIQSGNSDSARFNFNSCGAQNQTVEFLGSDDNSRSSIVNVNLCKLYQVNGADGGPLISTLRVDQANFINNWIYYGGTGVPFDFANDTTNFKDNLCVPNYLLSPETQRAWFKNYMNLSVSGNRFGAEGGGCTLVEQYGDAYNDGSEYSLLVEGNKIYASNDTPFKFYGLPSVVRIEGNVGYDQTPGMLYFDSSISEASIQYAMRLGKFTLGDYTSREYFLDGALSGQNILAVSSSINAKDPSIEDLIISANTNLGSESRISTSTGASTKDLGDGRVGRYFSGADRQLITFLLSSTAVTEIYAAASAGDWVTVVYHVNVEGDFPVSAFVEQGLTSRAVVMTPGDNIITIRSPLPVDSSLFSAECKMRIDASSAVAIGPLRVYKGAVKDQGRNLIATSSFKPTTGRFFTGDVVYFSSPVANGYIGAVAVTTGTPGSWKSFGAIVDD